MSSVVAYTTSWCSDCTRARRILRRMGVPYREIDIDEVDGAEAEMRRLNGGSNRVPTILVGDAVLIEPSDAELTEALTAEKADSSLRSE